MRFTASATSRVDSDHRPARQTAQPQHVQGDAVALLRCVFDGLAALGQDVDLNVTLATQTLGQLHDHGFRAAADAIAF